LTDSAFLLATSPILDQDRLVLSLDHAVTIRLRAKVEQWLSVVDGRLRFSSWPSRQPGPATPWAGTLLDHTPESSFGFIPDGPFLRVYVDAERRAAAAAIAGKHGWYLTADYSASPPEVVLTRGPTKDSRWTLVKADHTYGHRYIRNDNDLGRAAWLGIEEPSVRYQCGLETAAATLSLEKRLLFVVVDLDDGK
jgi:hypothetical protein